MAQAPGAARAAAAPPPDMGDDDEDAAGVGAADEGDMGAEDEASEGDVLLTVLKTPDGGYQLIQGDEGDGGEAGAMAPEPQTFDSPGALLKGILDILNKDESADGAPGSADEQFQSGYDENAPATPAPAIPQRY